MAARTGHRPQAWLVALAATMAAAAGALGQGADKPPVPPGEPVQGMAVVMLTTGIDYTRPSVSRKLARDGEGDLVGWDALDKDRRPFGNDPEQSRLAEIAPSLIIPVRIDPRDASSVIEAIAFARRTRSRAVVVPVGLFDRPPPPELAALVNEADVLLVVAGPDDGRALNLPQESRDRIVVVGALSPEPASAARAAPGVDVILLPPAAAREAPGNADRAPRTGAEAAILFVAQLSCRKASLAAAKDARDAKRLLLAAARKEPGQAAPVLEDCTRSLAPR